MEPPAEPVITYFPIRGCAEPIRLILVELGIKYRDNPVAGADYQGILILLPIIEQWKTFCHRR